MSVNKNTQDTESSEKPMMDILHDNDKEEHMEDVNQDVLNFWVIKYIHVCSAHFYLPLTFGIVSLISMDPKEQLSCARTMTFLPKIKYNNA